MLSLEEKTVSGVSHGVNGNVLELFASRENLGVYPEKCPSSCSPDAPVIETDSGRLDVKDARDIEAFTKGANERILRAGSRLTG
jgi:hypothetical protein